MLAVEWIQMVPNSAVLVATHEAVWVGERCCVMGTSLMLMRKGQLSD